MASDRRIKKDINAFKDGLNVLEKIHPVTFRYNGKAGIDTDKEFVGVLAQDMQKIAPYTVGEFTYRDSTGKAENYLDYNPNALTYVLVNAVKEQQAQLAAKDVQIAALETHLARLEALITKQVDQKPVPARLYQNQPNPYGKSTLTRYFLPETVASAQLKIFSLTGQEILSRDLTQEGEGQVELSNRTLPPGTYVYHLVVDGQSVDNKKLVFNR